MSSNGSGEGKGTQEETPTVEELQAKLTQLEGEKSSSNKELELLRDERQQLRGKVDQFEDRLLNSFDTRNEPRNTEDSLGEAGLDDLTDGEKALLTLMDKKLNTLKSEMEIKAERARGEIRTEATIQTEIGQIKRDNSEIFEIVSPMAHQLSNVHPDWSVQECWNKAVEKFKPLLDAQEAQAKLETESEQKVSGGPPSGPMGFDPELSEEEAFNKACEEHGLP